MSVITYCEMCREYNAAAVDFRNQAASAQADYATLLARHNALVEAVKWERELDAALVWLVQIGLYRWSRLYSRAYDTPRDMAGKYDLAAECECVRAEVDRLIGEDAPCPESPE
jgi:hypothetical protein